MKINVDFNRDPNMGQMRSVERKMMYDVVVSKKPKHLLEIGTWKGGGSTYILGCAAYEYGGILHTIEANKEFYDTAIRLYGQRMNILLNTVQFNYGKSDDIIPQLLEEYDIDFVLFDGAENADQTVKEYDLLNEKLGLGSIIACHDWKTMKMEKMKDVIYADNTWVNICGTLDTDTGFMMFERSACV